MSLLGQLLEQMFFGMLMLAAKYFLFGKFQRSKADAFKGKVLAMKILVLLKVLNSEDVKEGD